MHTEHTDNKRLVGVEYQYTNQYKMFLNSNNNNSIPLGRVFWETRVKPHISFNSPALQFGSI